MINFTKRKKIIIKIIIIICIGYLGYKAIKNKDKKRIFICKDKKGKEYLCRDTEKMLNKLENLKINKWY